MRRSHGHFYHARKLLSSFPSFRCYVCCRGARHALARRRLRSKMPMCIGRPILDFPFSLLNVELAFLRNRRPVCDSLDKRGILRHSDLSQPCAHDRWKAP